MPAPNIDLTHVTNDELRAVSYYAERYYAEGTKEFERPEWKTYDRAFSRHWRAPSLCARYPCRRIVLAAIEAGRLPYRTTLSHPHET